MGASATTDLNHALEGRDMRLQERVFTALPGVVQAFDPVAMTVDVQIAVKLMRGDVDGTPLHQEAPVLAKVPLCFPRAGGYILCFPVSPGDSVLLVFSMLDASAWEDTGYSPAEVINTVKHGLSSAVAVPGWFPFVSPLSASQATTRGSKMVLGKDNSNMQIVLDASNIKLCSDATEAVALCGTIDAVFRALAASTPTDVGALAMKAALTGRSFDPTTGTVGATKVKAK